MCGVLVVDAGRSRSTNLGHDAYVMIIAWISSWLFEVLSIANSNLFTHCLLFFSREATSETYGPRVFFLIHLLAIYFSFAFLFRSIKPKIQKYFAALYFIYDLLFESITYFWHRYSKGIDNPFNTSGCEVLLFVCRCCLRGVRRFSYWFDNLGLITEGNTYSRYATSSSPLGGIPT